MVVWSKVMPYWRIGVQYYLVGRAAFFLRARMVTGNSFHHAVEMLLKEKLQQKYTLAQLKSQEFGHRLPNLWTVFKELVDDPALDVHDDVIAELHRWEEIRYPPQDKELVPTSGLLKGERPDVLLVGGAKANQYHLELESIDELVAAIIKAVPLDVAAVKWEIETQCIGAEAYARDNHHTLW